MIRAVLDTNVLVAGLRSRSGAPPCHSAYGRRSKSPATCDSWVVSAIRVGADASGAACGVWISEAELNGFLSELAALVEPVEVHFLWRPQLVDASGEMVLETMINGRGRVLVTHNIAHFSMAARRFGLRVVRPSEFVAEFCQ